MSHQAGWPAGSSPPGLTGVGGTAAEVSEEGNGQVSWGSAKPQEVGVMFL